jgi:PAS domain S-box-containing protein
MSSGAHSLQRLSLVDQATSRWIAGASRRHPSTLLIMTGVIVAGDLLGAVVDLRAYAVMAVWFAIALVEAPWCARAPDFGERRRRYAITLLLDCVMLGAAYYYLDAARIAGISAFLLIVVSARVVLPVRASQAIAVLVLAVYVALLLVAVRTGDPVSSPVGLAALTGKEAFLAASAIAAAAVIHLVLRMQGQVLRTMREAESRHAAVVDAAADMILVVDERGKIVEVNAAMLARTGYTWDELKALPNSALFPPDEWEVALEMFRAALGGATLEREVRVLTKNGRVLWTEATVSPVQLGDRAAVVVVTRDVTERRQQQEQLRQNDAKLDLVLKTLNSGFYTIDREQLITSVRGRGAESGAVNRLVGKAISTIAPSPDEALVQREQHQKALDGAEVTWVWPVGSGRWVRSHVAPIRDDAGTVIGAAGFWRDETAVVRAREEEDVRWQRFRPADKTGDAGGA